MGVRRERVKTLPVDIHDDGIKAEARRVEGILIPDSVAQVESIARGIEHVVDCGNDGKEPCQDGEDLVSDDALGTMGIPLGKGIHCRGEVSM